METVGTSQEEVAYKLVTLITGNGQTVAMLSEEKRKTQILRLYAACLQVVRGDDPPEAQG